MQREESAGGQLGQTLDGRLRRRGKLGEASGARASVTNLPTTEGRHADGEGGGCPPFPLKIPFIWDSTACAQADEMEATSADRGRGRRTAITGVLGGAISAATRGIFSVTAADGAKTHDNRSSKPSNMSATRMRGFSASGSDEANIEKSSTFGKIRAPHQVPHRKQRRERARCQPA
eukprot:jgi/Tetstr1/431852/TSEL_021343.t1